jgi:hypothetical protein
VPQPDEPARGSLAHIGTDEWKRRLTGLFADDFGPARRLIEATTHELSASPIHTLPHLRRWHADRMIVIGDAAHAPSPSSGQGASLSIEDGVQLAKNLRDLPSPDQAFAAFDRARRPRVQRILKLIANSKHSRQLYGYHIDWVGVTFGPPFVPSSTAATMPDAAPGPADAGRAGPHGGGLALVREVDDAEAVALGVGQHDEVRVLGELVPVDPAGAER